MKMVKGTMTRSRSKNSDAKLSDYPATISDYPATISDYPATITEAESLACWDEPDGCTDPRGWLFRPAAQTEIKMAYSTLGRARVVPNAKSAYSSGEGVRVTVANYLDYGPDYYRSPHRYCRQPIGACTCRESQPGSIHLVLADGRRFPDGRNFRWFCSIEAAKAAVWEISYRDSPQPQ